MTISAQKISEDQASASTSDAGISEVLSAWERVFQSLNGLLRTHATLVAADLRLTLKAVVISLISILFLVGLGLLIWTTLLAGLFYGLTSYGIHWMWAILAVLGLNFVAFIGTKRTLTSALSAIAMKDSIERFFNS